MGRTPGMGNPLTLQLRCARGPFPLLFTPAHLSPIKAHDPEGSPAQPDSLDPSSDVQEEGCEGIGSRVVGRGDLPFGVSNRRDTY